MMQLAAQASSPPGLELGEEAERLVERAALLEAARRRLDMFVRLMWSEVDPRPLKWGSYLDILCAEMEAVTLGEHEELVVCLPPGLGKSTLCSVLWPAWELMRDPTMGILGISNEDGIAARDSRRCREVVRSPTYRALVAHASRVSGVAPWTLDRSQWDKTDWVTNKGGYRYARGVGGRVTGRRARRIIVDDAIDASTVLDAPAVVRRKMKEAADYYDIVLASRLDAGGARVVVQQRLAPNDLAGMRIAAGARAVILPMRAGPERADRHPLDIRADGEALAPEVFGAAREAALRTALGARHAASQLDQAPTSAEGEMFPRGWIHHLDGDPHGWPADELAISVDATFKGGSGSDFVVSQVWGRFGARFRLHDQVRARMDFRSTRSALIALCAAWPAATLVLIEEAANGAALISDLRQVLPGVCGTVPHASKHARAQLVAPVWESGAVDLPTPEYAPWIGAFVEELASFPGGPHDDQVDAMSQILGRWARAMFAVG